MASSKIYSFNKLRENDIILKSRKVRKTVTKVLALLQIRFIVCILTKRTFIVSHKIFLSQ